MLFKTNPIKIHLIQIKKLSHKYTSFSFYFPSDQYILQSISVIDIFFTILQKRFLISKFCKIKRWNSVEFLQFLPCAIKFESKFGTC